MILANAVLQWIPGHETLLPALIGKLKAEGALAVQMPDNLDEPSHRLMREGPRPPARGRRSSPAQAEAPREAPRRRVVFSTAPSPCASCRRLAHDLPSSARWRSPHAVVEWVKGTGLRPFLDPLDESEREAFLARYEAAIADAYPAEPDGTVLLPFPRLFFVAAR